MGKENSTFGAAIVAVWDIKWCLAPVRIAREVARTFGETLVAVATERVIHTLGTKPVVIAKVKGITALTLAAPAMEAE